MAELLDYLRTGDIDGFVAAGLAHRAELRQPKGPAALNVEDVRNRALCAKACLIAGDRAGAVESFSVGYVQKTPEGLKLGPHAGSIDEVRHPLAKGIAFGQLAALCYSWLDFEQARDLGVRARGCFPGKRVGLSLDELIGLAEADLWVARAEWRLGGPTAAEDALRNLDAIVNYLTEGYAVARTREERAALSVPMAQALSVMGAIAFATGAHDRARRRVYRAIVALISSNAHDSLHLACGYHLAAKFESSFSARGFRWAVALSERAEEVFKEVLPRLGLERHPWKTQATIQRAQSLVKAGREGEAKVALEEASAEAEALADVDEANRCRAEMALAWIWIYERQAEKEGREETWEKCAEKASAIGGVDGRGQIPARLQAEAMFHKGRALIHTRKEDSGRAALREALELARQHHRVKIESACHLALAESYGRGQFSIAAIHLRESKRVLEAASTESNYLLEWYQKLAPGVLKAAGMIGLDLDRPYREVQQDIEVPYVTFHGAQSAWREQQFCDRTKVNRNKFFEWKRKYGGGDGISPGGSADRRQRRTSVGVPKKRRRKRKP